jgi:hypothetical protein
MFMFKIAVIGQNWKEIREVSASSIETATQEVNRLMWWDCYSPSEYELSFIGKSKLS